jgi:hypothetical protein
MVQDHTPRNSPEERSSHQLGGGSLKSCIVETIFYGIRPFVKIKHPNHHHHHQQHHVPEVLGVYPVP